ncbi:MAG TPA: response regulator, partial [Candidatus Hydrogenedentes bacterium]|nr:response regulator [Candidatus Hydrogenedentota bacterium]
TVETGNITLDETYCTSHEGFFPGEFVCFVVTDTGMGMDEITRKSIFEPFFTTKEADKGTGLGMATVYGIVKQNNGFINIYSEPGLGTSVRIFLPRHAGAKERVQEQQQVRIPEGAGETVLFVEDEPSILKMGRRLLGRLGYNVLATCSPGEAIRLARDHENKIHLLVSDMIMPEMNGQELARHIQELFPKCGVLYMSGYTAETITRQGILNEGVHFIQKPFSVDQFARKVREIIDGMSGVPAE